MREFRFLNRLSPNMLSALIIGVGWGIASLAVLPSLLPNVLANQEIRLPLSVGSAIAASTCFGIIAVEIRRRFNKLDWLHVLIVIAAMAGTGFAWGNSYPQYLYSGIIGGSMLGGLFIVFCLRKTFQLLINLLNSTLILLLSALLIVILFFGFIFVVSPLMFIFWLIIIPPMEIIPIIMVLASIFLTGFIYGAAIFKLAEQAQARKTEQQQMLLEHQIVSSAARGQTLHIVDSGEGVDAGVRRKLGL
jgi:hypothetical protein